MPSCGFMVVQWLKHESSPVLAFCTWLIWLSVHKPLLYTATWGVRWLSGEGVEIGRAHV